MAEDDKPVDATPWGRDVERRHAWLLHAQNLAVGPVERFYTGALDDQYTSAIDGAPVAAPVVVLGTGHALLARDPSAFIEIGPDEATIYINTIQRMRDAIVAACNDAAQVLRASGQRPELPMALVLSALRAQVHALEATAATEAPPPLQESTNAVG